MAIGYYVDGLGAGYIWVHPKPHPHVLIVRCTECIWIVPGMIED